MFSVTPHSPAATIRRPPATQVHPPGKSCSIQFRRDALGSGASGPSSPLAGNIDGAEVAISGTLKSSNDEWVILDVQGRETWVPKAVILLIQF